MADPGGPENEDGDNGHVRVLGVDPGLTRCGVGVITGPASRPRVVDTRVLCTSADEALPQRLQAVYTGIGALIDEHRPSEVAVEQVLFSRNVRTAMVTGQAQGIALLAGAQAGLPVATYAPTRVKLTVAGHGGASKGAVGRMVAAQLDLDGPPSPADVADALAVALCHLSSSGIPEADGSAQAPESWEQALAANPHVRQVGGTG